MIKMFTPCYFDFRPKYSDIYHSPPFNQARSSLFFRSFLGAIIQFSVAINKKAIQQICTKNDDIWERDDLRICLFLYARVRKFCSAFNSPNPCQFLFFLHFSTCTQLLWLVSQSFFNLLDAVYRRKCIRHGIVMKSMDVPWQVEHNKSFMHSGALLRLSHFSCGHATL